MADESLNTSTGRRRRSDYEPGGEASGESSGSPKQEQRDFGNGSHRQGTSHKNTSAMSPSQAPIRDAPTPPIDVPRTDHGSKRYHYSARTATAHEQMDTEADQPGGYTHREPDCGQSNETSSTLPTGHYEFQPQGPPRLQLRTRSVGRSLLEEIAKERAGEGGSSSYILSNERSIVGQITSVTGNMSEEAMEGVPPLSESMKGASPLLNGPATPYERATDTYQSPVSVSPSQSPASAASSWYSRKYGSARPPGSVRRSSRRSYANSVSNSSPAAEFLRQYSSSATPRVPDGDSDGTEIGEYVLGREVGSGGFSLVREAFASTSRSASPTLAVKIVRKHVRGKSENENDVLQAQFEHELEIWKPLRHENILQLYEAIGNQFGTFAFMPLITGGSLWDAVKATQGKGLQMRSVKRYAAHIAQALRYLHQDMHLVHRDVKLENCLLKASPQSIEDDYEGDDSTTFRVLLADFGLAAYIPSNPSPDFASSGAHSPMEGSAAYTNDPSEDGPAGSLPYAAPELLNAKKLPTLSAKIDIWSYGVLLYALVTGRMPFQQSFTPKLVEMIKGCEFDREILQSRIGAASVTPASPDRLKDVAEQASVGNSTGNAPFRNESWANSVSTIVPTEGVPIDGDGLLEVVNSCLNTKPHERWDVAQLVESTWLASEVGDEASDGLEMDGR